MNFEVLGEQFYKDGEPVKILSGAVHYFRNMPDTWRDTFKKMKAMGLNCVETYCAWNMHEPKPGVFNFENNLDINKFIKTADEEGLMVIVRAGPYICAEWEFGGLPWWIQAKDNMEIRCMNKEYIECFEGYLDKLFDQIRPFLSTNGGPIIMMQCENEYGYYGDDKEYLRYIYKTFREKGIDVPLFTADGTSRECLLDGSIEGCLPMVNCGSRMKEGFSNQEKLFPGTPKMCMEMWNGWFDHWGEEHHTTSADAYAVSLKDMIELGSFNIYMFIGGTNFGFMNGASHGEKFMPDVTSYDYDALLTECGDVTPKYMKMREIIGEYTGKDLPPVPENRKKKAYGKVELSDWCSLIPNIKNLSNPIQTKIPKNMEYYGTGYGYIAYQTTLNRDYFDCELKFEDIGDRAYIFIENEFKGIVYVNDEELSLKFSAKSGDKMTILVENMGRTNFGSKIMRKKGILGRVLMDGRIHFDWQVYPLEMNNLEMLDFDLKDNSETRFYKGTFDVDECYDTFLRFDNFKKGFILINGFNIGRYWEIGPQRTLYVPASLLKKGQNEIVLFESEGVKGETSIEFVDIPELG